MAALQAVFEAAPRYFEAWCGGPPGPAEAQSTFTALPPGSSYDDKRVFGLYAGDAMIGVADVVRGWNAPVGPVRTTDALAFRRRIGFRETGEVRPAAPPFVGEVVVLEMPLARDGGAR